MKTLITYYFAVRTWWLAGALPYVLTPDAACALNRYTVRRACGIAAW